MDKITLVRELLAELEHNAELQSQLATEQNSGSGWGGTLLVLLALGAAIAGIYYATGGTIL